MEVRGKRLEKANLSIGFQLLKWGDVMLKIVVLSMSFVLLSATAMIGILPEIRDALGITQTQSELLATIPSISMLLFVIICDVIISKIGMKKTVIAGLLITGFGGVMPLFNDTSYTYLLVSRFIFGAGKGLIFTPSVNYISILFDERERATLIGFRSAVELFGQSALTLLMGFLVVFSWSFSFIIKALFFVIAALVAWKIPEVDTNSNEKGSTDSGGKIPLIVFPLALFVGIVALSGSMIAVRFPALATEIRGEGFNASFWVGVKPILGIIAAALFGKLTAFLGKKLLYLGTLLLITSQLMIGFSNGNFGVLVVGFLLSAFVLGWIIPVIISTISKLTNGKQQRLSTACTLICANVGVFIMPFVVQELEIIARSTELAAPYPIAGAIISISLVIIVITSNSKSFRAKVGLKNE